MRLITLLLFVVSTFSFAQKQYQKNYYKDGALKSAGWIENGKKVNYWYHYHNNGKLKAKGHYNNNKRTKFWKFYGIKGNVESEGHFNNDQRVNWWIYYDKNGNINHKCQVKDNQKNGYCLMYTNAKLTSAVKYSSGKKIKEWRDLKSFKKENNLSDLR